MGWFHSFIKVDLKNPIKIDHNILLLLQEFTMNQVPFFYANMISQSSEPWFILCDVYKAVFISVALH